MDAQVKAALAAALEVCGSVSTDNLAKRGEYLPRTLVDPRALRELADALEQIVPGAIANVRKERDDARAAYAARRFGGGTDGAAD